MTRGEKVCRFITEYLRIPEGKLVGQPIVLHEFQRRFILDIYDNPHGTSTAYLSVARKNGKSALIAGILLAHLVGPEAVQNSQIVSGAMSRDQAALVFNLACKMIQLNPQLADLVHIIPSSKRLIGKPMNVEYKALAAEGKTAHGLSPVLAILDEVGQIRGPRSDFVDAIVTSQGAHDTPILIAISTQAANDADLLSVWLDDAIKSKDPHTVCHLYTAPDECDLSDETAWKAANPALGVFRSETDLRKQHGNAVRMPSSESMFRNLCLNQRVSTASPFVSRTVWDQNSGEPEPEKAITWYAGLDLSVRTDLTSLILIGIDEDGFIHVLIWFWAPADGIQERSKRDRAPYDMWADQGLIQATPGRTVDYEYVAREIADILTEYEVQSIAFDRYRIDVLQKEFDRLGIQPPLVEFGQGFRDMAPALDEMEAALLNGRLRHGDHPVLKMCAANAVVTKNPVGERKLDKSKATGRIDGMVALAMAIGASLKSGEAAFDLDDFLDNPLVF